MDQWNDDLNGVFASYRAAVPDPEASANFMPELWRRIEGRRNLTIRFKKLTQVFLAAYLETSGTASFVPADRTDLRLLLRSYAILKAMYELRYELNNRPKWAAIPLRGLLQLSAKKAPASLVTA